MPTVTLVKDQYPQSSEVTHNHFGGNVVFTYNLNEQFRDGFTQSANQLGIQHYRFPGGTVTEMDFDIENPDTPKNGKNGVGLTDYISWVNQQNKDFTFVMPTATLFEGSSAGLIDRDTSVTRLTAAKEFIIDLLSGKYGDVSKCLRGIELGNEYFSDPDLSSKEYGQVANDLITIINEALDELNIPDSERPDILIQMGSPFAREITPAYIKGQISNLADELSGVSLSESTKAFKDIPWMDKISLSNALVMNEISDENKSKIDGLVQHYYYEGDSIKSYQDGDFTFIDRMYSQWSNNGFANKDLVLTEWNVKSTSTLAGGLKSAGIFIDQFEAMIFNGVDAAHAWPIQGNLSNDLGGNLGAKNFMSPTGAAFYLLQSLLPGMSLAKTPDVVGEVDASLFFNGENSVTIISSELDRPQTVTVNIGQVTNSELIRAYKISTDMETSDGVHQVGTSSIKTPYYLEHDAGAVISYSDHFIQKDEQYITIELDPYETVFITTDLSRGSLPLSSISEGEDWIYGTSASDRLASSESNDRIAGLAGDDKIWSGSGDDEILGHKGNDEMFGQDGNDRISGGGGHDIVYGGLGNDYISGLDGHDILIGGRGADVIFGGSGSDRLRGGSDRDIMNGGTQSDKIFGGNGDDRLNGDVGRDFLFGGRGSDRIHGGSGDDKVKGGIGDDVIRGGSGHDELRGGDGIDLIFGHRGNDNLYGGEGSDRLNGGVGKDILIGGRGQDFLKGGSSEDRFVFLKASDSHAGTSKRDVILDFKEGDILDFSRIDSDTSTAGNNAFDFTNSQSDDNAIWYHREGQNIIVYGDINGDGRGDFEVELRHVNSISASDFIF